MIPSNPFNIVGVRPLSVAPSSPKLPPPGSYRPPVAAADLSLVETRVSLVFAVATQAASASQRLLSELAAEAAKYVFPKRFESRNLEEALMAGS